MCFQTVDSLLLWLFEVMSGFSFIIHIPGLDPVLGKSCPA